MAGRIFAARLTAVVVTAEGVPVPDVRVTFTAPEAGPTARFTGGSRRVQVTTGPTGEATSPPVEAGLTGGTYVVEAAVAGGSVTAVFPLTNTDPTVVAAGDIACAPGRETTPSRCQQMATSELAISLSPDAVLPLGDDQYEDGTLEEFAQYDASWGRLNAIAYPIPGNHEYGHGELVSHPSGAEGYFTYFGDRSHPLAPGCLSKCISWYSYDLGAWHVIALDSECTQISGCNPGNPQYEWLLDDLNRHQTQCTMVYWHIPLFSSSQDRQPAMKAIFELAHRKGVDLVLNGHAHFYERFAPQDSAGEPDPVAGITQFTIGTGGRSFSPISATTAPNSEFRLAETFGVLQLSLGDGTFSWNFRPLDRPIADTGTASCH